MMRVALHSLVVAGQEVGYDEAHAAIPDDLVAVFQRVGIHDWTIWRSGLHLFHLVECDDFVEAMTALGEDEANARWQAAIGQFVDHFEVTAEGPAGMPVARVWALGHQMEQAGIDSVPCGLLNPGP